MIYDGTPGNDSATGSSSNDTLSGLAGDDFLSGAAGHDRILGGDGQDTLVGGAGDDTLDGGSGGWPDYVQYQGDGATAGATVNLALGTATDGYGGHDTLTGFDDVIGGDFADTITGDSAVNYLNGMGGNDTIRGGAGDDILAGEGGVDSIEGEAGSDTIFGGIGADILRGGTGDDVLLGANGNDTLDGGVQDWNDIADYYEAPFHIVVDLAQGVATLDGFGDTDTLVSIEGVYGSWFDDTITGDAGSNFLWGAPGDDTLQGAGGNDVLEGAEGNDLARFSGNASSYTVTGTLGGPMTVTGPDGTDLLNGIEHIEIGGVPWSPAPPPPPPPPPPPEGTPQDDILLGGDAGEAIHGHAGDDRIDGGGGADSLLGEDGRDTLIGGAGNDSLDGGSGIDTASFEAARAQYTLAAAAGGFTVHALQGDEGTDMLEGLERLVFSDAKIALDLDGHAGTAALILGAVAGSDWVSAKGASYIGAGLALLDSGTSSAGLMQMALDAVLGSRASDHAAVVDLLFTNITHAPPDAATRQYFVGLLDDHTYTVAGLALAAAESGYNAANIGLTGLAATGVEYT